MNKKKKRYSSYEKAAYWFGVGLASDLHSEIGTDYGSNPSVRAGIAARERSYERTSRRFPKRGIR